MAAEKVVVLDSGKFQVINPFPEMETDEHEPENMQDNSAIKCATTAIMYDQEDLSNDMPRHLVTEETRRNTRKTATCFTNHETYHMHPFPGEKCSLSEKIRSICRCWTELEGLPSDENLQRYIHALFCNTLRLTLSKEWGNVTSWDCENLRNALFHVNSRVCQALAVLLPSPWGDETVLEVIHGSLVSSVSDAAYDNSRKGHLDASAHVCTDTCLREPRSIPRTRVELLCFAGLKHEALRLCLYYHDCPVLSEESFYGITALHLIYLSGNIKHLIDEVYNLTCHDGFHLVQVILREHSTVHPLAECLMQILLVRDLVEPSHYCCTLALMQMWCYLHVKQGTSLEDVEQEVLKLGALATKSAHLYLLVDVLYKKYGRRLLPLYLNLYVHALTIDFNNLEYARQVDCRVAIAELETHMAGVYTKLASLLAAEEDQGLARECELTAFSLEPTIERLTKLRMYAMAYPVKWSYHHVVRLVPCSGECHCSEKGLCRRDPAVPPWFMTHVPSGILDSNVMGVSKQLLQDLCVLVEGPRCRWLTWNMPWRNLHEICMHYLTTAREFRACTDDRRVGIEARLKRLGPFDCSAIPVYRKGHDSAMDLQECILDENERKSATENCNEIDTSTVQDEMQINVSGTSEMKSEASEIKKNDFHRKKDAPEISTHLVPATDRSPDKNHTEMFHLLAVPPADLLRHQLQENNDGRNAQLVQMMHNKEHNESTIQTQAHLNRIKECNALSESGTSLLNVRCGQHELSPSSVSPRHFNCNSPVISPSKSLYSPQFNEEFFMGTIPRTVNPFAIDTRPAKAPTVISANPGLSNVPQTSNNSVNTKNICRELLHSSLNPSSLRSPECNSIDLSAVKDTLDVRIKDATCEPMKGTSPPPINLESLIAETLLYSPKQSYKTLPSSETLAVSAKAQVLHPTPVQSVQPLTVPSVYTPPISSVASSKTTISATMHTEYTNVTSTAGCLPLPTIHHCSASLMDHLYGKNMLQPIFHENVPVTNPSASMVMGDSSAMSSSPIYTTTVSGMSQNISTTAVSSHAKSQNLNGNGVGMIQSNSRNSQEIHNTQQPEDMDIGSRNVVSCARVNVSEMNFVFPTKVKHDLQSIGNLQEAALECITLPGSNTCAPIILVADRQYSPAAHTQGILHSNCVGTSAQGSVSSQSNSVQTFRKDDAKPKINHGRSEQMEQAAVQLPSRTSTTLPQQPVQAFIMQPNFNHHRKTLQLTQPDIMPTQHLAKTAVTSVNAISARPLDVQQTQNIRLAKPCARNLTQSTNQILPQSSIIATLPVARVQCPPTMQHSSRPQVSCNSKLNILIGTVQRQTPAVNPRLLETQQSKNPTLPKQGVPCFRKTGNQTLSQTSVAGSSPPHAPYVQLHSSGTIPSKQECNNATLPLKSRLQMYATKNRLLTRRPFNKPRTDGKPRWTTCYSPHGKMVHHKNGQDNDASALRATANVVKLGLTANVASTSSTVNNPVAGVQRSLVKMSNPANANCTSLTKPTATSKLMHSLCRQAGATVSETNFSETSKIPVAAPVSSEVANRLCTQVMSPATERSTIRPPSIAQSTGISKVSVATVVPPDMTFGRISSTGNRAVILRPSLTADAAICTVSTVQTPTITKSSSTSTGTFMTSSCVTSSSRAPTYLAAKAANQNQTSNADIIKGQTPNFENSSIGAKSSPIVTHFQSKTNSGVGTGLVETSSSSTVPVSSRIGGQVSAGKTTNISPPVQSNSCAGPAVVAPPILLSGRDGSEVRKSPFIGSTAAKATTITSRPPNHNVTTHTSCNLLAAVLSQPTVVLSKLGLPNRNIPVVKKCISPAILNQTLNRSIPIPRKLSRDTQDMSQSSVQDVSAGKDSGNVRPLSKENPSVLASNLHPPPPNLYAMLSLTKSQLEVSLDKQNSASISSPLKRVTNSSSKTGELRCSLLAKLHNEPQKCVCPTCNKVMLRKSLRGHMTKVHKDVRNIEFGASKRQELNNVSSNAKENSLENRKTNAQECTPVPVKEVSDVKDAAECTTDLRAKNAWLQCDYGMPSLDSRSVSETSIREQSTDSKSSTDEKSTDETSSEMQARFVHVPSSPKSQSDTMEEGSSKKEHLMATTSSEVGESYATRGRVSSRNIKSPQKRSCPCCENTSPNSSAKKCRDEKPTRSATSPRKSVHTKSHRKTRSSGHNDKSH